MKDQNLSHSDFKVVVPDQPVKVAFSGGREYIVTIHHGRRIPSHCLEFPISIHTPLAKAILGKKENTTVIYKVGKVINTVKIVKIS